MKIEELLSASVPSGEDVKKIISDAKSKGESFNFAKDTSLSGAVFELNGSEKKDFIDDKSGEPISFYNLIFLSGKRKVKFSLGRIVSNVEDLSVLDGRIIVKFSLDTSVSSKFDKSKKKVIIDSITAAE